MIKDVFTLTAINEDGIVFWQRESEFADLLMSIAYQACRLTPSYKHPYTFKLSSRRVLEPKSYAL